MLRVCYECVNVFTPRRSCPIIHHSLHISPTYPYAHIPTNLRRANNWSPPCRLVVWCGPRGRPRQSSGFVHSSTISDHSILASTQHCDGQRTNPPGDALWNWLCCQSAPPDDDDDDDDDDDGVSPTFPVAACLPKLQHSITMCHNQQVRKVYDVWHLPQLVNIYIFKTQGSKDNNTQNDFLL